MAFVIEISNMWSKIYLGVFGVATFVLLFFTYYSWSWLQSIGNPMAAIEGYDYHSDLAWPALWLFTVLLLFLGNAVLWVSGRQWALWATFAFFSIFIGIRYFWLEASAGQFQDQNVLAEGGPLSGPIFALILIFLMAVIVFFDQFIIERANTKTNNAMSTEGTVYNEDPTKVDPEVPSDE